MIECLVHSRLVWDTLNGMGQAIRAKEQNRPGGDGKGWYDTGPYPGLTKGGGLLIGWGGGGCTPSAQCRPRSRGMLLQNFFYKFD